eukprot:TRINITY_DN5743_c0_g2_i1.p1 TRINITY_DN5743_c0_g2~~TRINITY_DN5743_c0_g2_i1.p1  ORF type:complete len:880 (+),score=130.73 TRINITY_DN5743_c0_g2_i1:114-2642(+)
MAATIFRSSSRDRVSAYSNATRLSAYSMHSERPYDLDSLEHAEAAADAEAYEVAGGDYARVRGTIAFEKALDALTTAHFAEVKTLSRQIRRLEVMLHEHHSEANYEDDDNSSAANGRAKSKERKSEVSCDAFRKGSKTIAADGFAATRSRKTLEIPGSVHCKTGRESHHSMDKHDECSLVYENVSTLGQPPNQVAIFGVDSDEDELPETVADGCWISDIPDITSSRSLVSNNDMNPILRRWEDVVTRALAVAASLTFEAELLPVWRPTAQWLRSILAKNERVDIWWDCNAMNGGGLRRGTTTHMLSSEAARRRGDGFRLSQLIPMLEEYVVLDPSSSSRMCWAAVGLTLLLFDVVMLPLQAIHTFEDLTWIMGWISLVFWSLDMILQFFTAVYVNSELVRKLRFIAYAYARSWFLFDALLVVPSWLNVVVGVGSQSFSGLTYLRFLRFLRLLRIAKFERMLSEMLAAINSPVLLLVVGMVKLMFSLGLISHVNACIWFWIGDNGSNGWTSAYSEFDPLYKYLTAVHWAFTQFQGTSEIVPGRTSSERCYAALTVFASMLILSTFVSSLTNMMMQLQTLHAERNHQQRCVRSFLCAHNLSTQISVRVRKYLEWKHTMNNKHAHDVEVYNILPLQITLDLQMEVNRPALTSHVFFARFVEIYPRLSRRLCLEALVQLVPAPDELVFSTMESCYHMYFVCAGNLEYCRKRIGKRGEVDIWSREIVTCGHFMSEPAMWMRWQHRGDLLVLNFASILSLKTVEFERTISTHPPAHASCVLYAQRYLKGMQRAIAAMTDIIDPRLLITVEDRPTQLSDILGAGGAKKSRSADTIDSVVPSSDRSLVES